MATMIAEGLAMMAVEAAAYLEETITYVRLPPTSPAGTITIGAIPLPSRLPDYSVLGLVPTGVTALQMNPANQDHDFSILTSVLVMSGVSFLPASGDIIRYTINGVSRQYEVQTPVSGPYAWDYTDDEQRVRVHTKFLK
jgi:hypothetical protein